MKKKFIYLFLAVALCFLLGTSVEQTQGVSPSIGVARIEQQGAYAQKVKWSYEGETGPQHWGELDPSFIACKNGREQSPIHIESSQVIKSDKVENIQIYYGPTSLSVINNGHSIQANAASLSNTLVIEGKEYKLAQFHFHTPSEHKVNGQSFDMELHLVHQDTNGNTAVVGMMIQEGKENETLAPLWRVLPKEETKEAIPVTESIDVQALLPSEHTLFYYNGSLTTPPCTEGVKWVVLEKSIQMSRKQIQAFQQIFPNNQRPVQPLNKRNIKLGTFVELGSFK